MTLWRNVVYLMRIRVRVKVAVKCDELVVTFREAVVIMRCHIVSVRQHMVNLGWRCGDLL